METISIEIIYSAITNKDKVPSNMGYFYQPLLHAPHTSSLQANKEKNGNTMETFFFFLIHLYCILELTINMLFISQLKPERLKCMKIL